MHYCCPACRHWIQLDDEPAMAGQTCNFCFEPVRVASGLITQIAQQRASRERLSLRGADAWPPVAQEYLQHLHHEAAKDPRPQQHGLAHWAGPLSCAAILLVFGCVAQVYLGHRSARAESTEAAPANSSVVVPPLILEPAPNSVAVRAPVPDTTAPTTAAADDHDERK